MKNLALAILAGFGIVALLSLAGIFQSYSVGIVITPTPAKPIFEFTVKQYQDFTLDVLPSGEIIAIGLGDKLADKYGCDYAYPSLIGHTCGNVEKTVLTEILYNYHMNYYMVADDLKHNY